MRHLHSGAVAAPGFVDAHTHLLRSSAGVPFPWEGGTVAGFHRRVASRGSTPMDVPDPAPRAALPQLAQRLKAGLERAASAGLVEVSEMGMRAWWYLDALAALQEQGALPLRVRVYLASGLAEEAGLRELDARRARADGPWLRVEGVKFYADGWLVPRTCAMCQPFADVGGDGLLFMDAATLARRVRPLADRGWRIATHAIGDRAIKTVLDAYDMVWAGDRAALTSAAPRIEHASVQSPELTARIAESGVVACIQPSFAVTDAADSPLALGKRRHMRAYPWRALSAAGARLLAGSDFPIEVIEPLAGLARLTSGRSAREGFRTAACAPSESRLGVASAFRLLTDASAGKTLLSADPRAIAVRDIDRVEVLGTAPQPF